MWINSSCPVWAVAFWLRSFSNYAIHSTARRERDLGYELVTTLAAFPELQSLSLIWGATWMFALYHFLRTVSYLISDFLPSLSRSTCDLWVIQSLCVVLLCIARCFAMYCVCVCFNGLKSAHFLFLVSSSFRFSCLLCVLMAAAALVASNVCHYNGNNHVVAVSGGRSCIGDVHFCTLSRESPIDERAWQALLMSLFSCLVVIRASGYAASHLHVNCDSIIQSPNVSSLFPRRVYYYHSKEALGSITLLNNNILQHDALFVFKSRFQQDEELCIMNSSVFDNTAEI